jgi:histidine phosphotransferase ChpT
VAADHELRLTSLLAARLCHELIAPVTAICNGAELIAAGDAEFTDAAVALVAESARRAASRLQFYRFAYGFAGGEAMPGMKPCKLAANFFEASGIVAEYPPPIVRLAPIWQKLACNLLLLGSEGLPRGGTLALELDAAGPALRATGDGAAMAPERRTALVLGTPAADPSPRTVQAYFTALLAAELGCRIEVAAARTGGFRLTLVGSGAG